MANRLVDKEIAKFDSSDRVRVNIESTDTPTGNLPVEINENGVIDTDNSTSTPLAIDGVFNAAGAGLDWPQILVMVNDKSRFIH